MIPGYRSFTVIAHGGFSTVYSAYQDHLDRTVAIKVINADLRDSAAERRFTRECRATGRLTGHPHIITIFQAGSTEDRHPFIAMQYLPRGSVADRIQRSGPMRAHEALHIGAKIAEAMHAAHEARIIHRDVKPGNILLTDTDEPVLSDFGIASLAGSETSTSQDAFTPSYTAPEVLQGEEQSVATDIYALGATLFAMLAGSPPFGYRPGDSPATIVLRVLTQDLPALPRERVPESVENLLRTALARDPAQRPQTADAFSADLRHLNERLGHTVPRIAPEPVGVPEDVAAAAGAPGVPGAFVGARQSSEAVAVPDAVAEVVPNAPTHPDPPPQPAPATLEDHEQAGPAVDSDTDRRTGGAMQEITLLREGRPARPSLDTAPSGRAGRPRRVLVLLGATAAIVVSLVVIAVLAPRRPNPARSLSTSVRTASPTPSLVTPAPVTSADIQAARPTGLRADDAGATVTLTWQNGSRTDTDLIVQTANPPDVPPVPVQRLPAGAAIIQIADLDPSKGYCFHVGPVLFDPVGHSLIKAWSDYVCIRGATPPPS
ncbi:serine/threonine-protein kinase [Frankia sp. CiP3]|uniref:serine/threonine-protein kinase n=1 Tax=Frankia sp. CiP3 TaxID=2880971 RepID=UPI001EF5DF6D|nr:serine/threonine-protein kinase [Frankia sp. CiP3]